MKLKDIVDNISGFHTLSLHGECVEHNHTLGFSNETKRNSALKEIAARRIANGYSASAVTATLRAHGGSRPHVEVALYAAGGEHLNRQDVINARRAWTRANLDARFVGADFPIEVQMYEAKEWLHSQGYKAKCLIATRENDGQPSQGLVFADESRLETLRHRGWLTLMDSTHDTNWLRWQLYTVIVRDSTGSKIPCAHFLTEKEDGDIIASCIRQLKEWCGGAGGWQPRYYLTDDSTTEQKAVRNAWPDSEAPIQAW
jgi:hypothetical protein